MIQFILICVQSNLTVDWDMHKIITQTTLIPQHSSVAQKYHPKFHKIHQFGAVRQILDMTVRCKGYHVHIWNVKNLSITETAPNLQVQQSETYLQTQMPELYTLLHSWTINCVKCKQGTHSSTARPLYQHNNVNYTYRNIC